MFVCLCDDLIQAFLLYSNLSRETGGFELVSTITLALQVNRLASEVSRSVLVTPNPQHLWILLRLFYQIYKDGSIICQLFMRSLNWAIKRKFSWQLCRIK